MGIPKRKNDINVYGQKETQQGKRVTNRRQELLDKITKSDVHLPDSILHDDLDMGMLDFVKKNFVVVSDGNEIPIIPKILTIQRWGEFSNNWEFADEDGNAKLPFIAVIRKPDVQPGTNPALQRTIPDRSTFYYSSIPNWSGNQKGADIYKIPQPVAVDISFEITIVCMKFVDLNRFNKIVLQKFSSRQSYTTVKGHYIPIVLDSIDDGTPIESMDSRRFYLQNYKFTMLGFLMDSEEFEVKPAISRLLVMNEFIENLGYDKKIIQKVGVDISVTTFTGDGLLTQFSVGETIGMLFGVSINGLLQERDVDYFHVSLTSKITFTIPPSDGSSITIMYYKGNSSSFSDGFGNTYSSSTEYFTYTGGSLTFTTENIIRDIVVFDINGLIESNENNDSYVILDDTFTLNFSPSLGSVIGITYLY